MQKTQTIQQLYDQVNALPQLTQPSTVAALKQLETLQHIRLKQQYARLFSTPAGQHAFHLFCQHIYHHETIFLLNRQIEEALKQKIKFEKWLSQDLLNAISHSYQMAFDSLKLDLQLVSQNTTLFAVAPEDIIQQYIQSRQIHARIAQLDDLVILLHQCERFANSFLMRSALRMAKSTLIRRGFTELYDFLNVSLKNFKGQHTAVQVMQQVIVQEKQHLLNQLENQEKQ